MSDAIPTGRFVWYELLTSDPHAAITFYTKIVGWGTQLWPGGEQPYTMWTAHDTPIGGVMLLPEDAKKMGARPHWLGYLSTPDVDATVAHSTELGGKVLNPGMDLPEIGRIAILADPQGAVFAAFTPANPMPSGRFEPKQGDFSWHELATTDHAGAFAFYSALFGWEKTESMDMGEMGIYQMFGYEGQTIGGMMAKPSEMPVPAWLYYAKVPDVGQLVKAVQQNGGRVLNGPMEVPDGDIVAQCEDPQGAAFAIHSAAKA